MVGICFVEAEQAAKDRLDKVARDYFTDPKNNVTLIPRRTLGDRIKSLFTRKK